MNRPSKPRLEPVHSPEDDVAALLAQTMTNNAEPLNIFGTLAHHPWLMRKFLSLGNQILSRGVVPDREREIVILRTGWNCQAAYEFGQHRRIAAEAGLTEAEISNLAGGDAASHPWTSQDRHLIALADEICDDSCLSDQTYAELAKSWDDQALIELVMCVGYYQMVSGFLNTFGVALEEGTPGFPTA